MTYANPACEIPECEQPSSVGVGNPPKWVCIDHFNEYLEDASALIKRIVEAARGRYADLT